MLLKIGLLELFLVNLEQEVLKRGVSVAKEGV